MWFGCVLWRTCGAQVNNPIPYRLHAPRLSRLCVSTFGNSTTWFSHQHVSSYPAQPSGALSTALGLLHRQAIIVELTHIITHPRPTAFTTFPVTNFLALHAQSAGSYHACANQFCGEYDTSIHRYMRLSISVAYSVYPCPLKKWRILCSLCDAVTSTSKTTARTPCTA